jgi:hypothetical protein
MKAIIIVAAFLIQQAIHAQIMHKLKYAGTYGIMARYIPDTVHEVGFPDTGYVRPMQDTTGFAKRYKEYQRHMIKVKREADVHDSLMRHRVPVRFDHPVKNKKPNQ